MVDLEGTLSEAPSQRVFYRRRERCEARADGGSVHRTLSKSNRRIATRSSLWDTLSANDQLLHAPATRGFAIDRARRAHRCKLESIGAVERIHFGC
jgi:hypothetical protein